MASAQKTSSLKQGLRSSFSSGGGFSLGGLKKSKVSDDSPLAKTSRFSSKSTQKPDPTPPPATKSKPIILIPESEQLDVLDGVISEIEESKQVKSEGKPTDIAKTEVETKVSESKISKIKIPPPKAVSVSSQQDLGNVAQVVPQVLIQPQTALSTPQSSKKEALVSTYVTPESTPDLSGGVQAVERERTPEVPPEVESFLQHAQDHATKLPEEIVIADNQEISKVTHHPKTPVLVLPISPEEEKLGKKKNPKFSIRWLVEWSHKMMKKFSGKIVYRID